MSDGCEETGGVGVSRGPQPRINAYLAIESIDGRAMMRCRCGAVLGSADDDYKSLSLEARYPIQHAGPLSNPYELGDNSFELREYYCPTCLVLFETDVAMRGDPNVRDVELAQSALVADQGGNDR